MNTSDFDCMIIGAGASGLLAARDLSKKGLRVALFEARDHIGGRIRTLHDAAFSAPIELGAEFIHGKLPLTFALLDKYRINVKKVKGEIWQVHHNRMEEEDDFIF